MPLVLLADKLQPSSHLEKVYSFTDNICLCFVFMFSCVLGTYLLSLSLLVLYISYCIICYCGMCDYLKYVKNYTLFTHSIVTRLVFPVCFSIFLLDYL